MWIVLLMLACAGEGLLRVDFGVDCDLYVDISVGGEHSCGLLGDDTLQCWGDTSFLPAELPDERWIDVASGAAHVCALSNQQEVFCWGDTEAPDDLLAIRALSAAGSLTCGLTDDTAELRCWGDGADGLGELDGSGIQAFDVGPSTVCAVTELETLSCWGALEDVPVPDSAPWYDVAVGANHACGIPADSDADAMLCWGDATQEQDAPAQLSQGAFVDVDAGDGVSCGTSNYGQLLCWGDSPLVGEEPDALYDFDLVALSADADHGCGVTREGPARCWGDDTVGQATHP